MTTHDGPQETHRITLSWWGDRRRLVSVGCCAGAGGVAAATRTLPRDVSSFTGRQQELGQLAEAAAASGGAVGIYAIGGMAGVGKTAFAVHPAHQLAGRPGLAPDDPAVGDIAGLCGYVPLAIGMVARQLHHHPAWTAAGRTAELTAAAGRLEPMATENLSVAAAFDLSYADLTGQEQRLFGASESYPLCCRGYDRSMARRTVPA